MRIDIGGGLHLNYIEEGHGPPFLFTTGPSRSTIEMVQQRKLLSKHFRVIQYDTRGAGESDDADWYSFREGANDAAGLLKALNIKPGEVVVYGSSNGGVQTAMFAANHPEWPRALVIDGSSTHVNLVAAKNWRMGAEKTLINGKDMMDAANLLRDPAEAAHAPASAPAPAPAATATPTRRYDIRGRFAVLWELSALLDYPFTPHLYKIKCPVLYLHGDDDKIVGPGGSVGMHRATPGSTLRLIPKAGHIVLNNLPEIALGEILKFLNAPPGKCNCGCGVATRSSAPTPVAV